MSKAREELEQLIETASELKASVEALGPDSPTYKSLFVDLQLLEAELRAMHEQTK